MNETTPNIEFIIGEEKRLADLVSRSEVEPLLRGALKMGIIHAALLDEDDRPLVALGNSLAKSGEAHFSQNKSIFVEGEPKGTLLIEAAEETDTFAAIARLMQDVLQLTVTNNLKRMLTTEVHTSIVQESYEQLVATNRRLMESERRYRELAGLLEIKVEERTKELQKAYNRMMQQEKLAAVGQLAAGMAHEINTPLGFIRSNLNSFAKYHNRMAQMLGMYRLMLDKDASPEIIKKQTEQRWKELKLDFLLEDTGILLGQSISGVDRIARIVSELNGFAHLDGMHEQPADLNSELEQLLAGMAPQFPPATRLNTDLKSLPPLVCKVPLIVQAFANILDNAIKSRADGLELYVGSSVDQNRIVVIIKDNGCGISAENLPRIFDPFFTTRPVGSGSGMGLAVSHQAISGAGGSIEVTSEAGKGTTCRVILPVSGSG